MTKPTTCAESRYDQCDDALERFWAKVQKSPSCWIWTAKRTPGGYGQFAPHRWWLSAPAHRYAYIVLIGPIPEGAQLDHLLPQPRLRQPCTS